MKLCIRFKLSDTPVIIECRMFTVYTMGTFAGEHPAELVLHFEDKPQQNIPLAAIHNFCSIKD